jgi:hypothetical protein
MRMGKDEVRAAVDSWLAEQRMNGLREYIGRGRPLQLVPEEQLVATWVRIMRSWAAAPEEGQPEGRQREDIEAEAELRPFELPFDLVGSEIATLASAAGLAGERMDEETAAKLSEEIAGFRADELSKRN